MQAKMGWKEMKREERNIWRRKVKVNGEEKGKRKLMLEAISESFDGQYNK